MKLDNSSWIPVPSPNFSPGRKDQWPVSGIVVHFTAAGSGKGTADYFAKKTVTYPVKDPKTGTTTMVTKKVSASAHLVVDRDGTVYQCVSFGDRAWHAGPATLWKGSKTPTNVNDFTIGIEIANWGEVFRGSDGGWVNYLKRPFKGVPFMDKTGRFWEPYPQEQVNAVIQVTKAILAKYPNIKREDITGHENIQSNKSDPGPAWPWDKYLNALFDDPEEEAALAALPEDDDRGGEEKADEPVVVKRVVVPLHPAVAVPPPGPPVLPPRTSPLAAILEWLLSLFRKKA